MKKLFLRFYHNSTFGLLFRYGIVGILAVIAHSSVALLANKIGHFTPFVAHLIGFIFGLMTAYIGHYFYSFNDSEHHSKRFPKFVITSLIGLALHQGGVYLLVNYFQLDYSTRALPLLMFSVPVVTFLINRFWVFSDFSTDKPNFDSESQ